MSGLVGFTVFSSMSVEAKKLDPLLVGPVADFMLPVQGAWV